ncbi:hypothetical protein AB0H69_25370 [Streptomyces phaeochromogenes]|uniref:hypothetical protein n=1 Tax=Streptomyces phaeochromogenes TaxID=1923 RepID=UPI0033F4D68D
MRRKLLGAALAVSSIAGMNVFSAGPAQAAATASPCPNQSGVASACLFYHSRANSLGAWYVQLDNVSDYDIPKRYFLAGPYGSGGAGQEVKNNAAAVENMGPFTFTVYYNSRFSCAVACQQFAPLLGPKDLNSVMKNENASGGW